MVSPIGNIMKKKIFSMIILKTQVQCLQNGSIPPHIDLPGYLYERRCMDQEGGGGLLWMCFKTLILKGFF